MFTGMRFFIGVAFLPLTVLCLMVSFTAMAVDYYVDVLNASDLSGGGSAGSLWAHVFVCIISGLAVRRMSHDDIARILSFVFKPILIWTAVTLVCGFSQAADVIPPESHVMGLPEVETVSLFEVGYVASDGESGVQYVTVWYRKDGGGWTQYGGAYTSSPVSFDSATTGGDGLYEFYTIATDNANNVEPAPGTADATVRVFTSFSGSRVYVDVDAPGSQTGEDWTNAFHTITMGLNAAEGFSVEEVWVAEGTYGEGIRVPDGVEVYGGFTGAESDPSERDLVAHVTRIDGNAAGGGSVEDVVVLESVTNVRLDGFVISGGTSNGLRCTGLDATTTIVSCTIEGSSGEGVYLTSSSPVFAACTISANARRGLDCGSASSPMLTNCTVHGNSDYGVYCYSSSPTLTNCTVSGNKDDGICCSNLFPPFSAPTLTNCLITGNSSYGLDCYDCAPILMNCTVSGNKDGGIYCISSSPTLTNTIFEGNGSYAVREEDASSDPVVSYCLFFVNTEGDYYDYETGVQTGANAINLNVAGAHDNFDGDPLFMMGAVGTWTAEPMYDGATLQTTLTNTLASFVSGALAGKLINPDTSQQVQALIVSNTETSIIVSGNVTDFVQNGDGYQLVDYHIQNGSAALDRGEVVSAPSVDFESDPRPGGDGLVDIGVDEAPIRIYHSIAMTTMPVLRIVTTQKPVNVFISQ